jgi:hypothetical protein
MQLACEQKHAVVGLWLCLLGALAALAALPITASSPLHFSLQDYHQEIQDVMGTAFGVPEDVDEEDLMGELDALEDDMAAEADTAGPAGVPAYLQVRGVGGRGVVRMEGGGGGVGLLGQGRRGVGLG